MGDSFCSSHTQRIHIGTSDQYRSSTPNETLHHISASANASVDQDRNSVTDTFSDSWQVLNRWYYPIKISRAMVRDYNAVNLIPKSFLCVFRTENAFQHQPNLSD